MDVDGNGPARGILIVGCGYSGEEIARQARARGIPVWGTTRSDARLDAIALTGATPLRYSAGEGLPEALRTEVSAVVDCVGPPWSDAPDPTPAILADLDGYSLDKFVYLSSTSVYGDKGGAWVDEDTPCEPGTPAGVRRLDAEHLLLDRHRATGLPVVIARLPGIYGPGRSLLDRVRSGQLRLVAGRIPYSNRIHVHDLAQGVLAAIDRGEPGRTYLLADGQPDRLDAIAALAAELVGVELPAPIPQDVAEREIPPNRLGLLTDSKRLDNTRMRAELGVALRYPTFEAGLRAVFAADSGS
jgi:nucleoside-diphosphate-sugar epimerase